TFAQFGRYPGETECVIERLFRVCRKGRTSALQSTVGARQALLLGAALQMRDVGVAAGVPDEGRAKRSRSAQHEPRLHAAPQPCRQATRRLFRCLDEAVAPEG